MDGVSQQFFRCDDPVIKKGDQSYNDDAGDAAAYELAFKPHNKDEVSDDTYAPVVKVFGNRVSWILSIYVVFTPWCRYR
jgi:hypothetical protein